MDQAAGASGVLGQLATPGPRRIAEKPAQGPPDGRALARVDGGPVYPREYTDKRVGFRCSTSGGLVRADGRWSVPGGNSSWGERFCFKRRGPRAFADFDPDAGGGVWANADVER